MSLSAEKVRGELVRWARVQQALTMRWIFIHGGPSIGFQSEVESGKKSEVSAALLDKWIGLLHVTKPFVLGAIPQFAADPDACQGMASEIGREFSREALAQPAWASQPAVERARMVLRRVAGQSQRLPRVVLAYVLGVTVNALDGMLLGDHPVMREQMQAIAALTGLPESFFTHAILGAHLEHGSPHGGVSLSEQSLLAAYLPVMRLALEKNVTPDQLAAFIQQLSRR